MKNKYIFTIIGSGTSGWLTALYLEKYYPYCAIRVISSSDIGILGAGEGTTSNVLNLLTDYSFLVTYYYPLFLRSDSLHLLNKNCSFDLNRMNCSLLISLYFYYFKVQIDYRPF